jgi:HEAT repeat protein
MRTVPALVALACVACTSSAARQARQLYDRGDYAGAAQLADAKLAGRAGDDDLWGVRIRALLAQGDARGVAADYAKYVAARGGDDADLVIDMAIATLDQGLDSTSAEVRIQSIGYIEDLALEPLAEDVMDQMESEDDRVAAAAAVAILRGHPQAPYILEQLQHSDDPLARAIAIEGIGRKVGKHADDDLRRAAADPDPRVRAAAMGALGGVFDEVSTRSLAEGLADADPMVRTAAARALADRRRGALAAYAKTALADEAAAVRLAGVAILAAAKDVPGLQALLGGADLVVAVQAAAALRGADPAGAARAIDAALASDQSAVRVGAVNLMQAAVGKGEAFRRAHPLLADKDLAVRLAAARVLAYQEHADEAIPVFAAALDGTERLSAAADLARLGDARGTAALSAAILSAKRPADRARAAAMHGSARRITPGLVASLADPSGQVRVVAAFYLIKLARDERIEE